MRILVIDEEFPLPLNSGKRIRTVNLLKNLEDRHEILFLHRGRQDYDPGRVGIKKMRFISTGEDVPNPKGLALYTRLFANLFSENPFSVSKHRTKIFGEHVRRLVREEKIDLVQCEWSPLVANLEKFGIGTGIPVLLIAHNVENLIWKRVWENAKNPVSRWFFKKQYEKFKRFERNASKRFPSCVAVSKEDAVLLKRDLGYEDVTVVENGVDIAYFSRQASIPRREDFPTVVFSGAMDWRPNVDASVYFIRSVLPLLKESEKDVRFVVAGRNPDPSIRNAAGGDPSVEITGTVDDIRPYIGGADIVVVPLRIGGGSRLKILEAMSMEMPVVSTTVGAEGLEVTDQVDISIADSPRQMADSILRLFRDPEEGYNLGRNGRTLVVKKYSWPTLSRKLEMAWPQCEKAQWWGKRPASSDK
jgi:glycosyltransferase involved in cell wall biosynthesis